jgi:hypothetical protein
MPLRGRGIGGNMPAKDPNYWQNYYAKNKAREAQRKAEWYMRKIEPTEIRQIRKSIHSGDVDPLNGLILAIIAQAKIDQDDEWLENVGMDWASVLTDHSGQGLGNNLSRVCYNS